MPPSFFNFRCQDLKAAERRAKSEEKGFREKGRKRGCPARVRERERTNEAKSCPRYQLGAALFFNEYAAFSLSEPGLWR